MRNTELMTALIGELKSFYAPYKFLTAKGEARAVNVYWYGPPDYQEEDPYPFVICRLIESELVEDRGLCTMIESIAMALGVYSNEGQELGGKLLSSLYDTTMLFLHSHRVIGGKFERKYPIKSFTLEPDRRWSEYHSLTITTDWTYLVPVTPLFENGTTFMDIVEVDHGA